MSDPLPLPGVNAQGIARLLSSSKGLVFLGVVTAGVVLVLTGHLTAEGVYSRIIQLAMVYFPAVAVEDASRHLADRPRAAGVVVNVPTVPPPPPANTETLTYDAEGNPIAKGIRS